MQSAAMIGKLEEEFSLPVESIMRCEDFKSNFARRLSNRYISKTPVVSKDTSLKLLPTEVQDNAPERIEPTQLSKSIIEHGPTHADRKTDRQHLRNTEVSALNLEVETLRWQLSQTEANRQMHIALLKQIVSFLSRVKEHIEGQKPELTPRKESMSARVTPRSFNVADLPRSRSVVHVNKNTEFSLSPVKKITSRKISKSISNVNGYRDCNGSWSPSKLSLTSETESAQKITEEMSRLITLANTVLSTKLPDLANNTDPVHHSTEEHETSQHTNSSSSLNLIEEDTSIPLIINVNDPDEAFKEVEEKIETKEIPIPDFILPIKCGLENDFTNMKIEKELKGTESNKTHRLEKRNEYNAANFIEDESGFSSMSSFQEIGIPIISIIPPSPCKEVEYIDEVVDILDENTQWKNDTLDLDKQAVKVFWV